MNIGIVGLPNVGKSTLFHALTKKQVDIANYPFCTINPNTGVVKVPDERLELLSTMSNSTQIIPAAIEFVDIAGLVKGASQGEGLGNKFLSHIREVDAIAHVVRVFPGTDVVHVSGATHPLDDIEVINLELIYADLATLEKKITSVRGQLKSGGDRTATATLAVCERLKEVLERGVLANTVALFPEEEPLVRDLHLLTRKKFLVVLNTDESGAVDAAVSEGIREKCGACPQIPLCIKLESECADLTAAERTELVLPPSGLDRFICAAYETLSLITYLTTGPKETRAWTIQTGTKAPQAAGVIHTDFERGFIRAEVINWKDLLDAGSETAAKEKGLIRQEGKEYIVKDGDTIVFRVGV